MPVCHPVRATPVVAGFAERRRHKIAQPPISECCKPPPGLMVAWASGLLEVMSVDFVPALYSWVSTPSLGGAAVLVGGGLVALAACRRAKHPDSVAVWWEENAAHDRWMWWREVALLVSLVVRSSCCAMPASASLAASRTRLVPTSRAPRSTMP